MNITATLLAQMVAFALFIWLVQRYLWAPVNNALEQRRNQISDGLAAADQGRRDLENARTQAEDIEAQARNKANKIISLAEKRAEEIEDQAKTKAREESDRIRHAAQSDIDQQLARARESLRRQVSQIAIKGAERILQKTVDPTVHTAALKELEGRIQAN